MQSDYEPAKPAFALSFPPTPRFLQTAWVCVAGVVAVASLVVQHGFPVGARLSPWLRWLDVALALVLVVDLVGALFKARPRRRAWELRRIEVFLLAGLLTIGALAWLAPDALQERLLKFLHAASPGALSFALVQFWLLLSLGTQTLRATRRLFGRGVRPELVLAGSFAALIALGTLLLWVPNSTAPSAPPISLVDAWFTATSATCVTGLVVRDTGTEFSSLGQMIILALFQMGGLGIITFVAFLSVFATRALPVPQLVVLQQVIRAPAASDLRRLIFGILALTALVELSGVILLLAFLPAGGDALERLEWCVFHSVSAFCNAGFAFQVDSLVDYRGNLGMMVTFMLLIVLGGLGFLVVLELVNYRFTRTRHFRRLGFFRRLHAGRTPARLSTQTQLAVRVTAALLFLGFVGFWGLEHAHLLRDMPLGEGLLAAAFQSVTARTAGFNTVEIGDLRTATLLLLMLLMVVGASPLSMGGGIKTVSFGLLLLALRAMVLRRDRVELFGRTVPTMTLVTALSVFVLYTLCAGVGTFLLACFDPHLTLRDQMFEVISALSTVGLSTGITAQLSVPSKAVLCVAMFIGRVGPLALVLCLFQGRRAVSYDFPEAELVAA